MPTPVAPIIYHGQEVDVGFADRGRGGLSYASSLSTS